MVEPAASAFPTFLTVSVADNVLPGDTSGVGVLTAVTTRSARETIEKVVMD